MQQATQATQATRRVGRPRGAARAALEALPEPTTFEALVGRNLRVMRVLRGYTQESVAARIGYSRTQLINIERGQSALSLRLLYNLCGIFGVAPTDVLPTMAEAATIGQREWTTQYDAADAAEGAH